jgi:thiamine-monophosphate kinase
VVPSEFELIDRFVAEFPRVGASVRLGPGDDCAIVRADGELCVTTDQIVEDRHFTRAFSPEDIGHKALAVNLSDLAAMGARPSWFLCAIAMPRGTDPRTLRRIARGMAALAREARISLAGGNFTAARELSIAITAAGEVPRGAALRRDGGRAGDLLYVSGELGAARLGLERMLARGARPDRRQRRPTPRLALGLLARGFARAAIDLSDGLGQDLGHLCRRSKVGAEVRLFDLPVARAVRKAKGEGAAWFAAEGGEDYELLLAVPPGRAAAFERACRRAGEEVSCVGRLTRGAAIRLVDRSGHAAEPPRGHDHFG